MSAKVSASFCWLVGAAKMPVERHEQRGELDFAVEVTAIWEVGPSDRGFIEVEKRADVCVVDLDALTLHPARMAYNPPAGSRRVVDDASGYTATIDGGVVTRRDGVDTGARPGPMVREAR
jgi:N-acyl-D-aspartate/D-glutamate deacylase